MIIKGEFAAISEAGLFRWGLFWMIFERLPKLSLLTAGLAQGHDARMEFYDAD